MICVAPIDQNSRLGGRLRRLWLQFDCAGHAEAKSRPAMALGESVAHRRAQRALCAAPRAAARHAHVAAAFEAWRTAGRRTVVAWVPAVPRPFPYVTVHV